MAAFVCVGGDFDPHTGALQCLAARRFTARALIIKIAKLESDTRCRLEGVDVDMDALVYLEVTHKVTWHV